MQQKDAKQHIKGNRERRRGVEHSHKQEDNQEHSLPLQGRKGTVAAT